MKKIDPILLIFFVVGLLAAIVIVCQRGQIEAGNKTYDIVIDYSKYAQMADQSGYDTATWLRYMAKQGVTKVAVLEVTLDALNEDIHEDIWCQTVKDMTAHPHWRDDYPAEIVALVESSQCGSDTVVTCGNIEELHWLDDAFSRRAEDINYKTVIDGDVGYLWIYGNENNVNGEQWMHFGLGLWPKHVQAVEDAGCSVIPYIYGREGMNGEKYAKDVFAVAEQYQAPYFLNTGDGVIGGEDKNWEDSLTAFLKQTNAAFVVTEAPNERGNILWPDMDRFFAKIDYRVVRSFKAWDFVMKRYGTFNYDGPEEIVNALYRGIYERNCRLILLNAIIDDEETKEDDLIPTYITKPQAYKELMSGLQQRMDRYGFSCATVTPMPSNHPLLFLYFLLGLGEVAAAIILLELFITVGRRRCYLLLALGIFCVIGALLAMTETAKILLSIAGGTLMPTIAAVGANRYLQRTYGSVASGGKLLGEAVLAVFCLLLIALCGGIFVAAALSDSAYMYELRIYRGVKAMQLIPLLLFLVSYFQVFLMERRVYHGAVLSRYEKKAAWQTYLAGTVQRRGIFYGLIAAGVVCVIGLFGVYYMIRTGNIGREMVLASEIKFRTFLEQILIVRPRTKEFLIGYPSMLLLFWAIRRELPGIALVFGGGMVIGLSSIVNTFLHIRSGIILSLCRVSIGLCMGLVIGVVMLVILELLFNVVKKRQLAADKNVR